MLENVGQSSYYGNMSINQDLSVRQLRNTTNGVMCGLLYFFNKCQQTKNVCLLLQKELSVYKEFSFTVFNFSVSQKWKYLRFCDSLCVARVTSFAVAVVVIICKQKKRTTVVLARMFYNSANKDGRAYKGVTIVGWLVHPYFDLS